MRWIYQHWLSGALRTASRLGALILIGLSLAGYAGYLLFHTYCPRTIEVCALTDFSFREQRPAWASRVKLWFAEVNRIYEPAKVRWKIKDGGEAYPETTEGSLGERRVLIQETSTCKADIILGLTGRPDSDKQSNVPPFGNAALISIAAKDSDLTAAVALARGLGNLFGAGVEMPAAALTSTAAPAGDVFDAASLKAVRDLRWYDFRNGVASLTGKWETRAVTALEQLALGKVQSPRAQAHRVLARAFTDAFKHDQAILQLRQAVQAAPGNASLRMELALELQSDAQAEKALKELTEAVRLAPEDGRPHAMRAAILLNSQQIDEAVEELRIAVRLEPRNAAYESVLGRALASQIGRVNEAAAAFEAAARLKPGEDGALNEPGMVTSLRDGAQDATRALRADVQQNANSVDAHLRLGVALAATGDLDAAQTEFQRGIELEPKNGMAHLAMARLHYLRGDYAAAGAEIESAKAFGAKPNSAFASVVQRKLGR